MDPQELQTITEWSGGKLILGDKSGMVSGISTDSRSVRPGELFLALAGERFDGHDFIDTALNNGASGVIVSRSPGKYKDRRPGRSLIVVDDTLPALKDIARGYRLLFDIKAIAVTGSNGKTTTKDFIAQLLGTQMEILAAPASYNNVIGVSLTILELSRKHRAAVFELGMNQPGEIRELTEICRPGIAVITNIGPAHIGLLGSMDAIAAAKSEILEGLEGEKVTFYNADDERVRKIVESAPGEVIGFGFNSGARIRAANIRYQDTEVSFDLKTPGGEINISAPFPGRHNVYNLLAALAVGEYFGMTPARLKEAAGSCALPSQRMERIEIGGVTVINDAYNANPSSMRAALETWFRMACEGDRIMVTGDMNELGEYSQREHQLWGEVLSAAGLDLLVFVGGLSREAFRAALDDGFPEARAFRVEDADSAVELLAGRIKPGDSILIKGSRAMRMEDIVRGLKKSKQ